MICIIEHRYGDENCSGISTIPVECESLEKLKDLFETVELRTMEARKSYFEVGGEEFDIDDIDHIYFYPLEEWINKNKITI